MINLKEGAENVEARMTFIQQFLQKKYGFGILFFAMFLIAICVSVYNYNQGIEEGEKASSSEIKSLKNTNKNDKVEIHTLSGRVAYYKKMFDSCNKNSSNQDLENLVIKKIQEGERLKAILEKKIYTDQKLNDNLNNIIK